MISYRDPVACVSHKKEGRPQILELFIGKLLSNLSHRLTWIKRKVLFSDIRSIHNVKALDLEGDDFRVDGAFFLFRVPAEETSKAVARWRGRDQFMKANNDPTAQTPHPQVVFGSYEAFSFSA